METPMESLLKKLENLVQRTGEELHQRKRSLNTLESQSRQLAKLTIDLQSQVSDCDTKALAI